MQPTSLTHIFYVCASLLVCGTAGVLESPAWVGRTYCDMSPSFSVACLRSERWPGAYAVGTGTKVSSLSLSLSLSITHTHKYGVYLYLRMCTFVGAVVDFVCVLVPPLCPHMCMFACVCMCVYKQFLNIYIGYGQKSTGTRYTPPVPPPVQEEVCLSTRVCMCVCVCLCLCVLMFIYHLLLSCVCGVRPKWHVWSVSCNGR